MRYDRVYIAGKISGEAAYKVKFTAGVLWLLRHGWRREDIVNPVNECPEWWSWWRCMVRCLRLVAQCDQIALLPNWTESRGARIEERWARLLRKKITYITFEIDPNMSKESIFLKIKKENNDKKRLF